MCVLQHYWMGVPPWGMQPIISKPLYHLGGGVGNHIFLLPFYYHSTTILRQFGSVLL